MRRREFLGVLGGAAAWPLAARAQQRKLPTIGYLGASTPRPEPWTAAFVQRLRELGWIEGRTVAIEYRWAEGRSERYRRDCGRVRPAQGRCHCHACGRRRSSRQSRRHRSSRSSSRWRGTRLAAAWSRVWRDRAATSPACRSKRPILLASGSNCCARSSPAPPIGDHGQCWQSRRCAGDERGSGSGPHAGPRGRRRWKSGERRTSRPPSRRSRAAPSALCCCRPARYTPTGSASTPWR